MCWWRTLLVSTAVGTTGNLSVRTISAFSSTCVQQCYLRLQYDERRRVWWLECVRIVKDMCVTVGCVCALEGLNIHIYDESGFFKILRFFKKSLIFKTLGFDAKPRVFSQTLRFHRFLVPLVDRMLGKLSKYITSEYMPWDAMVGITQSKVISDRIYPQIQ